MEKQAKQTTRAKKRLGRGLGSGKGKTAGRGQKGQKARGKVALGFSGGGLPMYKKLPLLRGWGNKGQRIETVIVKLGQLNVFKDGDKVDLETLVKSKIVVMPKTGQSEVKVLSGGELSKKVTVSGLKVSRGVKAEIEKIGGKVE